MAFIIPMFARTTRNTDYYALKERGCHGTYMWLYRVDKKQCKDVRQQEMYGSKLISNAVQHKIISDGLKEISPKHFILLPVYRELYETRRDMFYERYNGCEWDEQWWTTDSGDDGTYQDTVPYQVTHHFECAMTRPMVPEVHSNHFPNDEIKSRNAIWLNEDYTLMLLEFATESRPDHIRCCKGTSKTDFLLALIYYEKHDKKWGRDIQKYISNFHHLVKNKKMLKLKEKKIRDLMKLEVREEIEDLWQEIIRNNLSEGQIKRAMGRMFHPEADPNDKRMREATDMLEVLAMSGEELRAYARNRDGENMVWR